MRIGRAETAVAVLAALTTLLSYSYVSRLLQGVTAEKDWIYWVSSWHEYTKVKDIAPFELWVGLFAAILVVYFLGFRRKVIWQWFASHSIPSWLSQTSIAVVVERYLTDNYALQRKALKYIPQSTKTVLDVGCGGAAYLSKLTGVHKVGLDASSKRLRIAKEYCDEVIQGDITEGIPVEVDTALCFEVIEHLTEEQGDKLLRDLEKFPTVILTTPREWFEVRRDGYERHQSFWSAEKLSQYGYEQVDKGRIPPSNIYVRRSQ